MSLNERIWFLSFIGGASLLIQEGASVNFFSSPRVDAGLSPLGALAKKFKTFSDKTVRGEAFTPYAVVLNHYHGLGLSTWAVRGEEKSWNHFGMTSEEKNPLALFESLWPGSFYRDTSPDESKYLVQSPIGDTVDVLTDAASASALNRYNVLFLSGPINWNADLKSKIWNGFLPKGGWVVLERGSTQDAIFADLGSPVLSPFVPGYGADQIGTAPIGGGRVVRIGNPAHYPLLIKEIEKYFNPFRVDGEISYSLSRLSQTKWLMAIFNNYGITKGPLTPVQVEANQGRAAAVTLRQGLFTRIEQVYGRGAPVKYSNRFEVGVPQGEVLVLELETNL